METNPNETPMTATEARRWAKEIGAKCSDCFTSVKAVKQFGRWLVKVNGGREACYGKTVESVDAARDLIRIFTN